MNVTRPDPKVPPSELGSLLRYWRDVRGVSQLDLSLEAGVSQRQITAVQLASVTAQACSAQVRRSTAMFCAAIGGRHAIPRGSP